ncbi:MAG: ATP-binding cassette domain-containing protein [Opitutales bacterium]
MTTSDKMSSLIKIRDLRHSYKEGESIKEVLHGINLDFYEGQIVIIVGPSGSGKTTLLKLIGAQLSIQEGQIEIQGEKLQGASQAQLRKIRRKIGFIFQSHHLLDSINVLQNVQLPLAFDENHNAKSSAKLAMESLEKVSIANQAHKNPSHLSGGQKQRVAIARALVGRPSIILADEPTASLDEKTGREIVELIKKMSEEFKVSVILVTHDNRILDIAHRIIKLVDGLEV